MQPFKSLKTKIVENYRLHAARSASNNLAVVFVTALIGMVFAGPLASFSRSVADDPNASATEALIYGLVPVFWALLVLAIITAALYKEYKN